jgi:hypothetical protein
MAGNTRTGHSFQFCGEQRDGAFTASRVIRLLFSEFPIHSQT